MTPNLGVIQQQESFEREPFSNDLAENDKIENLGRATLADLPGLIAGAHMVLKLQFFLKPLGVVDNFSLHIPIPLL